MFTDPEIWNVCSTFPTIQGVFLAIKHGPPKSICKRPIEMKTLRDKIACIRDANNFLLYRPSNNDTPGAKHMPIEPPVKTADSKRNRKK